MSCNGCRVLRKGCSEECLLRQCLQWIGDPQAQSHATLFVAKFFGRASLMSFLSSVPSNQRSDLFRSLLYESVGRAINPVNGAVGLLWTGNWHLCQLGVDKVLRGGALNPLPPCRSFFDDGDEAEGFKFKSLVDSSTSTHQRRRVMGSESGSSRMPKRKSKVGAGLDDDVVENSQAQPERERVAAGGGNYCCQAKKQRAATPSDESETITTSGSSALPLEGASERKLLKLFS